MIDFLLADGNVPFSVSLVVMFGIALLEGVSSLFGAALSGVIDSLLPEMDMDVDSVDLDTSNPAALSRFLGWLRFGEVPVLMLLVIFLTAFGLIGLAAQSFLQELFGQPLPALLVAPFVGAVSLPVVRITGGGLARIMPRDETDAVPAQSLVGRTAVITLGTARSGSAAEARVRDIRGTTHYLMVEPDNPQEQFTAQETVLIVRQAGSVFKVIAVPNEALVDGDKFDNNEERG